MGNVAVDLDALTADEQLDLLEQIWERLSRDPAKVPLPEAHRLELDRRLDELEDDIRHGRSLGTPWSEVRSKLRR